MKTKVKKTLYIALVLFCLLNAAKLQRVRALAFDGFTVIADEVPYVLYPPEIEYTLKGAVIKDLDLLCERIWLDRLIKPTDATLVFSASESSPFTFTRESAGKSISKEQLKAKILRALELGENKVVIKSQKTAPKTTVEQLKDITVLRARFSTYYASSEEGRKQNVELCAKALNGSIISSGAQFSFNERVGERTKERGYTYAKVIEDGVYTEGIGGGVCQVSTTLYNAMLRAGIMATECNRHSLAVGYVEPSFDAMVSSYCDLKFKNTTKNKLYITAFADGERITVSVYGEPSEYEYRLISHVCEIIQAQTKRVKAESGIEIAERLPKNGLKSEGYVSAYKNGELVFNRKIREDIYKAIDGIIIE